jgi:hypothetical protein
LNPFGIVENKATRPGCNLSIKRFAGGTPLIVSWLQLNFVFDEASVSLGSTQAAAQYRQRTFGCPRNCGTCADLANFTL